MEKFHDGETLLAIVFREADWAPGLHFQSSPEHFLQVGTWYYPKDKLLNRHSHKVCVREIQKTQELAYVVKGAMEVELFSEEGKRLHQFVLKEGDYVHQISGGHGYKILKEGTKILEVKNGPFLSVEADKTLF